MPGSLQYQQQASLIRSSNEAYKILTKEDLQYRLNILGVIVVLALVSSGVFYLYTESDRALTHLQVMDLLDQNPDENAFIVEHPKSVEIIHRSDICPYQLVRIKKTEIIVKCGNRIANQFQNYLEYYRTYGEDMWVRNSRKTRSISIDVAQTEDGFTVIRRTNYYKKQSGSAGSVVDIFKVTKDSVKISASIRSQIQQNMRLTYKISRQELGIFDYVDYIFNSYVGSEDNKYYYGDVRGDFLVDPRIILHSPVPDIISAAQNEAVNFNWTVLNPYNSTHVFGTVNTSLYVLVNTTGWVKVVTLGVGTNATYSHTMTIPAWTDGVSVSPYRWRTFSCDNRTLPAQLSCVYSATQKIILGPKGGSMSGSAGEFGFEAYNITPVTGSNQSVATNVIVRFDAKLSTPLILTHAWLEVMVNSSGFLRQSEVNDTCGRMTCNDSRIQGIYNFQFDWRLPSETSRSSADPLFFLYRGVVCHNSSLSGNYSINNCTYTPINYLNVFNVPGAVTAPTLSGNIESDTNVTCTAGTTNGTVTNYYFRLFADATDIEQTIISDTNSVSFGPSYNKSSFLNCSYLVTDGFTNSSWSENSTGVSVLNSGTDSLNISIPNNGQIFMLNGSSQAALMINFTMGSDGDDDILFGNLTWGTTSGSALSISDGSYAFNSTTSNCTFSQQEGKPCSTSFNWTLTAPSVPGDYFLTLDICDVANMSADPSALTGKCTSVTTNFAIGVFDYRVRYGVGITDFIIDPSITDGINLIPEGQTDTIPVFQLYLDGTSSNTFGLPNVTMNINDSAANISDTTQIWCGATPPSSWGGSGFVRNSTYGANITSMAAADLNLSAVHSTLVANTWNDIFCLVDRFSYTPIGFYFGFLMDSVR